MINKGLFTSNSQEWRTPRFLYNYYMNRGYFDICQGIDKFNGLEVAWQKKTFCNPPYNEISKWVDKALYEASKNGCHSVLLIPARTDTQWFKRLLYSQRCCIRFIEGRLKFNDTSKSAPFPSMLVYIYHQKVDKYSRFDFISKEILNQMNL